MEFTELIQNRESIRNYDSDKKVTKETLYKILNAGRLAPSAVNYQPWKFLVVSSDKMLAKVRTAYERKWFQNAPHVLVVIGDEREAWTRLYDNYNSIETDLTIAMDHMILAAENEGVATCWIAAYDPEKLRDALSLEEYQKVFAITPLGYPEEGFKKKANKKRKDIDEVVEFI